MQSIAEHDLVSNPDPRYCLPVRERQQRIDAQANLLDPELEGLRSQLGRSVVDRAFLVEVNWLLLFGWTERPMPAVLVVLTSSDQWFAQEVASARLRRPDVAAALNVSSLHDCGVMIPLRLPDGESVQQAWLNGSLITCEPIDLRGGSYLQQLDDLLVACNLGITPLEQLPNILYQGLAEALLHLREPLKGSESCFQKVEQQRWYGPRPESSAVTVVVPLYGRWDFVKGQLAGWVMDSAFTSGEVSVLYVVDDPRIEQEFLTWCDFHLLQDSIPVSVVSLTSNTGFSMACNIGVNAAESPEICLLNSDVLPLSDGWLAPLRQQLSDHPDSLVAPLLLLDSGLVQHAGMEARLEGSLQLPINRHPLKGLHPDQLLEIYPHRDPFQVQSLSGAALMFHRDYFLALGGFDPVFGRGDFEDLELSLRWTREGGKLWMVPASQLVHLERQSISRELDPLAQWRGICNAWMAKQFCPELE
jgi:GT2 family glycosyltransferase